MKPVPQYFKLRYTDLRDFTAREFVGGRDFRIDHRAIMDALLRPLKPEMVDLLRIASSVFFIDRVVKRDRKAGPDGWPRKIACSVQVWKPDFWNQPHIHEALEDAVRFVSGDDWRINFLPPSALDEFGYEWQRPLFRDHLDAAPKVFLQSTGLDSIGGFARRLLESPEGVGLAVTVQHRTDLGKTSIEQTRTLAKHFAADFRPVVVPFEMTSPKKMVGFEETSQRARSFLFVAIGGVIAGSVGASSLELFESGIGALNAPLLAGMEGSQTTRSAHPTFLKMMSRLLSLVCDACIDVTLPFANLTKGEVIKSLGVESLKELASSTVSCVHYPVRIEKGSTWKSCGVCPACIFRRVALHAAGIEENPDVYLYDLLGPRSCWISHQKLRYLMAFLTQIDSLAELDKGRLPPVISRHMRSTGLLEPGDTQQPYLDLFQRYRNEWRGFLERARNNGCDWASRIDLPNQVA